MQTLIGRIVPVVMRHLEAYAEVAAEDARDAAGHVARKLIALLVAAACAFVSLLMFCTWLLVLAWDTPWRPWMAAGLTLLFAGGAAALAWASLKRGSGRDEVFFPRIRDELTRDRELFARAFNGTGKERNGDERRTGG